MAAKAIESLLPVTLVEISAVPILWGVLFSLAVCTLIISRFLKSTSLETFSISRVGKDPNTDGLKAARRDFLVHGHSLIKEGYMNVGSISIPSQCFLYQPIRAAGDNTCVSTVVDGSL